MRKNLQISKYANKVRGQSLFEIVVALGICALVVVAIISLTTNSVRNSNYSKNNSLASNLVQQSMEWLRGQRDENIGNFIDKTSALGSPTKYCFLDLSWNNLRSCSDNDKIQGIFLREGVFNTSFVDGKTYINAKIVVRWVDSQGTHEVESSTDFSDWRQR